jgi:putative heme iron utilization protein
MRQIRVDRHGSRTTISCWLFSSAVEKGVLLRSRVLAAIGPTANDTAWAAALAAAFAHSPPILTT